MSEEKKFTSLKEVNDFLKEETRKQELCPKCKIGMIFLGVCCHCYHEPNKEEKQ